jgi:hypothetical protein
MRDDVRRRQSIHLTKDLRTYVIDSLVRVNLAVNTRALDETRRDLGGHRRRSVFGAAVRLQLTERAPTH